MSTSKAVSIETLVEESKPRIIVKYEFENNLMSKRIAGFGIYRIRPVEWQEKIKKCLNRKGFQKLEKQLILSLMKDINPASMEKHEFGYRETSTK